MAEKIWFITGASRGFGREWTIAALERGDKVAATARDLSTLDDLVTKYGDALLPIKLDVTDREADFAAVAAGARALRAPRRRRQQRGLRAVRDHRGAHARPEARDQLETNVFGALWVTQAALPFLREQRSGHIVQVSSIGGITAFPNVGIYHASKWALEGFSQALAQEVAVVRHPRHADRARRLLHRLGRAVVQAGHGPLRGLRRGPRGGQPQRAQRMPAPGRPHGVGRGHPQASSTRRRPPLRVLLRRRRRWKWPRPTTRAGWRRGRNGSRSAELAQG